MACKNKFCDLNVLVSKSKEENIKNVRQLITFGYKVIALNHELPNVSKEKGYGKSKPFIEEAKKLNEEILAELKLLSSNKENDFDLPDDIILLTRATLPVSQCNEIVIHRQPYYREIYKHFDLIALKPENEKVLRAIAEKKVDADIISLPLDRRDFYDMPRKILNQAVDTDMKFEILYTPTIKSVSLRKAIFYNAVKLVNFLRRQKGIIITSGGGSLLDFRSPADVMNMARLFEIKDKFSCDVITKNSLQAVVHGQVRSKTFVGGVIVEKVPSASEPQEKRQKMVEEAPSDSEPQAKRQKMDDTEE